MSSPLRVFSFKEWCAIRGFSPSTGWRLIRDGKVTVTQLSEHRIGIREDHDAEYLERCIRAPGRPRKVRPVADAAEAL